MGFSYRFIGSLINFKVFNCLLVIITNKRIIFYNTIIKEVVLEIIHSLTLLDLFLFNNEIFITGKEFLYKIENLKVFEDKKSISSLSSSVSVTNIFQKQNNKDYELSFVSEKDFNCFYIINNNIEIKSILKIESFSHCIIYINKIVIVNSKGIFFYDKNINIINSMVLDDGICTKLMVYDYLYISFENGKLYSYNGKLDCITKLEETIISFDISNEIFISTVSGKIYKLGDKKIVADIGQNIKGIKVICDKIILYEKYVLILDKDFNVEKVINKELWGIEIMGNKIYLGWEGKIEEKIL